MRPYQIFIFFHGYDIIAVCLSVCRFYSRFFFFLHCLFSHNFFSSWKRSELFSNITYDSKYSWTVRWNKMKAACFGCGCISPKTFFQNLKALKCLHVWIWNVSFQFSQKKTWNFELSSLIRIGIQIHANWVSICVYNFRFIKSSWHCSLNNVQHKRIYAFFTCSSSHIV